MREQMAEAQRSGCGAPLGGRLRAGRETLGLSVEEVAQRLKMPRSIVLALESDDWERLGGAVFVRGHLRAYARLLGLPASAVEDSLPFELPPLAPSGALVPAWRRRLLHWGRVALYAVLTAFIAVPVVLFFLERGPEQPALLPLDEVVGKPVRPRAATGAEAGPSETANPGLTAAAAEPLLASLFPPRPSERETAVFRPELRIVLREASWLEVIAADGSRLEFATLPPGSERRFDVGAGLAVTLGNAGGAELAVDGRTLDLEPWTRANVARFRVSSRGEIEAPAQP